MYNQSMFNNKVNVYS